MTVTLELPQLIALAIFLVSAFGGIGKLLLMQHAKHMDRALKDIKEDSKKWIDLERQFLRHLAELPITYVRREDYVRGQTVIEAKLDAIANELKLVQIKGGTP